MIHLFAGNDTKSKLSAYQKFVESLPKGEEVLKLTRNDFDPNQIESFYSGPGLFSKKSVIIFSNILEHEETRDFILEKLERLSGSDSSFLFVEGKLAKPILDAFKEAKAEMNIFELPKAKLEKFDNFLLANAFGARDKLNLWIYFRQAIGAGVSLEELAGVLFWKIKDMLLKNNFSKFSEEELKTFVKKLAFILPESRTEGTDAEVAFERFLLEAF